MVSEVTIMETMKPYFEFLVMRIVCGIPQITPRRDSRRLEEGAEESKEAKEI